MRGRALALKARPAAPRPLPRCSTDHARCAAHAAPQERDRLFAEIRVLKQLKHKNIMTFYDSWLDTKTMSINFITELFTSGTLRQ